MRSLLTLATAGCWFATEGLGAAVELGKRDDNITLAAPVVGVPSEHWDGTAGTWSSFEIHAGTPQEAYRVMPATSWQETWLVFGNEQARYCNTSLGVPADCAESRGGVYTNYTSTTWNGTISGLNTNQLILGLDSAYGESGQGIYGFDTVGFGYATGQGPTLNQTILAEIVSDTWWLGVFGMGFQPTNFSGYAYSEPSFTARLFSDGTISSKTWSYTAGAFYRLKGVFGSMIFGGYDASRFVPNDVRFTMSGDVTRDIVLSVRQITSSTSSGNTTLMSTPILAFIDSAVPELWLPVDACQAFEKAFGIELDPTYSIYLLNDSTHDRLTTLNPNITLTLGDQTSGGNTVDITLPYAAFDHNITAPLYNGTSWWFPLMQESDSTAYTLGRTFLQEAYVTANYHTNTFNVSQATFNDPSVSAQVIAIPSVVTTATNSSSSGGGGGGNDTPGTGSTGSKKLGGGTIAGIVIAALAVVAIAASIIACFLLGLLCFPSRRKDQNKPSGSNSPVHEIDTGKRIDPDASAYASQASNFTSEVQGQDAKVEIQGNPIMHPQELEAEVPIPPGYTHGDRVSGPSDSSRVTEDSNVSSLSPITEQKTPMAELGAQERGLGYGVTGLGRRGVHDGDGDEHIVSPNSPTIPKGSLMGRREGPEVNVASPTVSSPSEAAWSPGGSVQRTGSRFRERLEN